ncbi:hypothetical protein U128_02630 [Anaplasma marginale str. Gypsy Plains]|uniref:hypothetical protein n=1 Tax=Anaplasma marginale TaxID=770 RepID=UPI0003C336DD|nr:hypothetical protein [Anaplasma marginale]AGZ79320.1 hypothetical protein U128_02620 [Anaplasma marginale str. Gypsy Plains]AGZ79321.1 hypothetical protein U128_02630 [Anaplasma marginale str. Gypsy Plains]RCL19341.1 hypothetical protein DOS86_05230 [Anaplasma marginale]
MHQNKVQSAIEAAFTIASCAGFVAFCLAIHLLSIYAFTTLLVAAMLLCTALVTPAVFYSSLLVGAYVAITKLTEGLHQTRKWTFIPG